MTLEQLRERVIKLLSETGDFLTTLGRAELIGRIATSNELLKTALYYLNAPLSVNDKLDRVALAITWFMVMFETSPAIVVDARSTDDGFMLRAIVEPGAKLKRGDETATARKTFYTRQLFFYSDTRPFSAVRALCERRATEIVNAVFEAAKDTN